MPSSTYLTIPPSARPWAKPTASKALDQFDVPNYVERLLDVYHDLVAMPKPNLPIYQSTN